MTRISAVLAVSLVALATPGIERPAAADPVLFRSVRVFDGTRMLQPQDVLVADGKIARVGRSIAAPAGATVVEGAGRTLMPGLIDSHTHAFLNALEEAIAFGVTTELDMFSQVEGTRALRARLGTPAGEQMADLRSAGTLVTAPRGHGTEYGFPIPTIERPDEAQAFVDARIAEGSDYIKIVYDDGSSFGRRIPTVSKATMQAVIEAAHRRDRMAVVHIQTLAGARDALNAGADGLVHLFVDSVPEPGFGRLAAQHRAFVIPTLSVVKSITGVSGGAGLLDDSALVAHIPPNSRRSLATSFPAGPGTRHYEAATEAIRQLKAANVPILAGTDAPNPGTAHGSSMHSELELLVEAGLTPLEALAAATSRPAAAFHLADRGRIAEGLRADLLLVQGDPSEDIRATRRIVAIWKREWP